MFYETLKKVLAPVMAYRGMRSLMRFIEACKYLDCRVWDQEGGNRTIYQALASGKPQAIGKLGSNELYAILNYLWFDGHPKREELTLARRRLLYETAGVYPDCYDVLARYSNLMIKSVLNEMTVIGVWFNPGESTVIRKYARSAKLVPIRSLEPYYARENPWSKFLEGKRVLVVHPFSSTIRTQCQKRLLLWRGREDILPEFELLQIKVPQLPSLVPPLHSDWFSSLEDMQSQMSELEFDVALIGAGAYSLPLAVHAKKLGKHGIHLGGALQIYFGIKGRRWDQGPVFMKFFNEHWIRPLPEDTPPNDATIEGGCYW